MVQEIQDILQIALVAKEIIFETKCQKKETKTTNQN
jgi:hypothetical protein